MATATSAAAPLLARPACDDTPPLRRRKSRLDDALVVGTKVSAWKVEGELGRGGMASVHAVVHSKFGKRAAIKIAHRNVIGDQFSPETFWREARVVHRVDHPAVIDVFATGSNDGRPYMVMERLAGKSLGQIVDDGPPMARHDAIAYLLEICDALRAAHAAGVVHRDVKLDNVFLCDAPFADGRRVKLLDWGVARIDGEEDPFRGLIAGTLTYVAPEQIRGDELTGAADIYSLAVLAYHLLCRRPPFKAPNDLQLIHMHLRAEPPAPSIAWPECPHAVENLLLRMLAKTPEERPTLDEIEDVLRDALDDVDGAPMRFADGSRTNIPVPALESRWTRWLLLKRTAPIVEDELHGDVLGRPLMMAPAFRPAWMLLATAAAALATLVHAIS